MAGPSLWRALSTRAQRFGSDFPLTDPQREYFLTDTNCLSLRGSIARLVFFCCKLRQKAVAVCCNSHQALAHFPSPPCSCSRKSPASLLSSEIQHSPPARRIGLHELCTVSHQQVGESRSWDD